MCVGEGVGGEGGGGHMLFGGQEVLSIFRHKFYSPVFVLFCCSSLCSFLCILFIFYVMLLLSRHYVTHQYCPSLIRSKLGPVGPLSVHLSWMR